MSSPHPPADMTTLLAFEAGQRDAVARIVAWLREQYPATCDMADTYVCEAIDRIADAISLEEGDGTMNETTLVRCPCCQGYRDRGDGTHEHCGWCDDEGEVTPERAAEFALDEYEGHPDEVFGEVDDLWCGKD